MNTLQLKTPFRTKKETVNYWKNGGYFQSIPNPASRFTGFGQICIKDLPRIKTTFDSIEFVYDGYKTVHFMGV